MSESIVRKVQPFTIGTRLSVPSVTKCQEFPQSYLPSEALDNCVLQRNLNSLYLSTSQVCAHGSRLVLPTVDQTAPVKIQPEHVAAEDHLNQNIASPSAVSRSIKKITISGSKDQSDSKTALGPVTCSTSGNNNNNNNISSNSNSSSSSTPDQHLPKIVEVSCKNKPNSQFKVLLSKDGSDEFLPVQEQTWEKLNGEKSVEISAPELQKKELERRESHQQDEALAAAKSHGECFTQRNFLFNKEALQAEAWMKSKLQDLKDGCNVQHRPLHDWEEASQTLHRDLKDFENTLIQLNQLGEQLICKLNPTSDLVKKQLSQLREQWQTLKQTAANQTHALGGARSLQEFDRKVDKLEAWIKEKKEEEQSLVSVLGENVDKMQLTRRILDLKQDEQLHRNLHEEINNLALKLEKLGKADGKNITIRKKHINKMWLKVQSYLKNYHENLQVALEISSFYQQADNTLDAINNMRRSMPASKDLDTFGDREIRDIAGQIMMLDVSVSQLPKLHPGLAAGVTKKQAEVKDCWALLQRDLRSDRTTDSLSGSTFTREDADLLTPAREAQCIMGSETHGIMGKEVKEEQNRLKGSRSIVDDHSQTRSSQQDEQQSVNHSSSPEGNDSLGVNEAVSRHELSRKPREEPRLPSGHRGHPQLHLQLQKFTLSADKTLSWLKDNVSVATQVCLIASSEGLEAARRCQQALEQEILNNRARIEVVKREGHGLVRAQHPGSARIEEFLSQLEVLWEELRRRHQRNAVFLQASEKLGFRVVKVLQALGSLEAWLESVELSMKASAIAGDPETMSRAERESCLLEKEVAARGVELSALRQEVDRLHGHSHPHTRGLAVRMEELERKYHCVLSALTLQSSKLQDTRMLTEFLEHLELDESQELIGGQYNLNQPRHSDISSVPTLLGLQSSGVGDNQIETMGDPVEELREAVEMLNDTVRERGRSQSHDHAIRELLSKHASLAVCVEECLCSSKELSLEILEKETDMAVQCEPDRCGFGPLRDRLGHLESDYEIMKEDVKKMENQALRLKELCPEKAYTFEVKTQSTLQAWSKLGKSVMDNRSRLQEFVELQGFFRSYLAMISWTEDTRSRIFSDTALHLRREGQRPLAAELDIQIELKFNEFDELAAKAKTLLNKEHHLTQMVKERMEELRSMLGWISVHWRAQKQQWLHKQNREEPSHDNIYSEATMWNSFKESLVADPEIFQQSHAIRASEDTTNAAERNEESEGKMSEDGYEIMNRIGPRGDSPKANITLVKESSSPPVGGALNLILSFGNTEDSQVQVLDLPAGTDEMLKETSEPIHRVSTYLHVKDNTLAVAPVYESITLPRLKNRSAASDSPTLWPSASSSCSSQSSPVTDPQTTNVGFRPTTGSGSSSIFCSLKRMSKKRKRQRDERRHTIQRILDVDEQTSGMQRYDSETVTYNTQTWPLKEGQRKKSLQKNRNVAGTGAYMKNPLLKDIDSKCSGENSITPYAVSSGPTTSPSEAPGRSHCRVLSLGSVLSFDLPKDMTLIPSIQEIITIAPPESKKADATYSDPLSQRKTVLSSFRQTHVLAAITGSEISSSETQELIVAAKDLPDEEVSLQPSSLEEPCAGSEEKDEISSDTKSTTNEISPPSKPPIYMNQVHNCCSVPHKHECLSVHTLIRDLNGHQFHKCTKSQCEHENSARLKSNQASLVRVNLKSTMSVSVRQDSVDSGISTSSSFKLCTDAPCPDQLRPKGVVGKLISLEVGGIDPTTRENYAAFSSSSPESVNINTEPVHVDHQQFEEEEEELEDIWKQNTNYRQSICSDIMYQPNQTGDPLSSSPPVTEPPVLYRNLVTASEPNLLIAEFKLPPHIQSCLGYEKWQSSKDHLPPLATADRRSWAAFPNREPASKTAVMLNETASDPVKLPDIGDNPRYVYQYREEEEVEQKEMKEGEELTTYSQNQSMSLLSVNMGLNEACQKNLKDVAKPQERVATGGRCFILSGKPEHQSMEGTLERKHKLQLGGKKAASRGWNSYHAVLYRHTLCFFQDRKDTLRSSACGLPLNLMGAECSAAPDYTKKTNCFRLRLRDGSEYLFNTTSRFLMKKWIMKIQASTGQSELMSSPTNVPGDQAFPISLCQDQTSTLCHSQHKVTHTFPRLKQQSSDQTKEIVVLTREQSHMLQSQRADEKSKTSSLDPGCCDDDDDDDGDECSLTQTVTHRLSVDNTSPSSSHSPATSSQNWLSSKHRSHSFTSATYQKIKPMQHSPGGEGVEKGSNYCVTLVVGGSSADSSSISRGLEPPVLPSPSWQPDVFKDSALKSYSSLPRPRNKSVFKKFFGKKEP
uniref:PH domain-containing protein n=1 Tax=Poecilia mexicana TaxID=48701 RepID=A0A3B3WMU9_9TELE